MKSIKLLLVLLTSFFSFSCIAYGQDTTNAKDSSLARSLESLRASTASITLEIDSLQRRLAEGNATASDSQRLALRQNELSVSRRRIDSLTADSAARSTRTATASSTPADCCTQTYKIEFWTLLCTGIVGLFVGLSELINRYKSFSFVFRNKYSWGYMLLNMVAAILVYWIVVRYDLKFGSLLNHRVGLVLTCGLGAMGILRSSFFNYRDSAGKVMEVGPAAILTIFLRATERQFDQCVAELHLREIAREFKGFDFNKIAQDLPVMILSSMQVLSSEEQKQLSDEVLKLVEDTKTTAEVKVSSLGMILVKYTGFDLLRQIVVDLKSIYGQNVQATTDAINAAEQKLS